MGSLPKVFCLLLGTVDGQTAEVGGIAIIKSKHEERFRVVRDDDNSNKSY